MKALINKLKALLCSYICRPDEHSEVENVGIVTIDRGDEE